MERELLLQELPAYFGKYPGDYYLKCEREQLTPFIQQIHGYFLVQIGLVDFDLNSLSTITNRFYVSRNINETYGLEAIESHLSELPFQFESVDLFILPHTLEFVRKPSKLLKEIYHILIPGGKLILFGFNPLSLVGMSMLLKPRSYQLWREKLPTTGQIKGWLIKSGFSVESLKIFCFRPPLLEKSVPNKFLFLESLGNLCFPYFGNLYMFVAEKKAIELKPIKKKLYAKKIPVRAGFPEPSTNKSM
jgi:ubiquinone/menaquinone biosynthesis C-methylase UbiE